MIGYKIKKQRELLNLTQEELATKLGYKSKSTINKIENGTNDITQSKVVEFAKALDTTTAYLMGWEEPLNAFSFPAEYEFHQLIKGIPEKRLRAYYEMIKSLEEDR